MASNITSLDRAVQVTLLWLEDFCDTMQWTDKESVYKAVKSFLQATRARLPVEEVVHFASNLPLIMKGLIMDGYDLLEKPVKADNPRAFLELVQEYYDYRRENLIEMADIQAIIAVLRERIGKGPMDKVAAVMPLELKPLFCGEMKASQVVKAIA